MTIKAIIEMMDKLEFSNTAKHRVSYDLLDSYERISPSILSGIVNKFAKYQLLNADNVKIGLVTHYKGGRTLALYLNNSIKTNFEYWQSEEKLKKLTGNVWEIHVYPCGGNWYTVAYLGETLLGVSKYPVEAFPDNIRCVQYKEIVDYNSETYILE